MKVTKECGDVDSGNTLDDYFDRSAGTATGTVTNRSGKTVDVFIAVRYFTAAGILVDSSRAHVQGLRPGETGAWETGTGERFARCTAEVDSAFAQ
ncbi:FxLYD domain-containing protein [Ilumatobacter sp.]|uniref:FxLYD domain-containing protein n=1 Tax=Ilumatobacter sp. TaxID=1967498 RepID=UPI0037538D3C